MYMVEWVVLQGKGVVMLGEKASGGSNLFVQIEHVEEVEGEGEFEVYGAS